MIKLCDVTPPPSVYTAIEKVLDSGIYVKGPKVEEFEALWADRCGMRYCVGVSSGAMALEILCQILEPTTTFPWTYQAVWNAMDRILGYHGFDTERPDIYAHHLHDQPPRYKPLIEDCSHCHGYMPVADNAIFSFFPAKILGACGDAGAIVTNSPKVYDMARELRNHGEGGTNGRMDEIQAAVLIEKLKYLDRFIQRRMEVVLDYDLCLGRKTPGAYHYAYAIKGSEEKRQKLINMGVESKFYYDENYMALPLHPYLTKGEIKKVIKCVQQL